MSFDQDDYVIGTHNLSGTLDGLSLLDQTIGTEEHNTDLSSLQVHAHTLDTGCEPVLRLVSMCDRS